MATFELWKAKFLLKDIINQLQLPKATVRRILMLLRTVWRIPAQEP
jgi:DNA-binding IclR family transcriptional regulator